MLIKDVVVLSEKGLEITIDNNTQTYKNIEQYVIQCDIMLFCDKNHIYVYDLSIEKELCKLQVTDTKAIKLCECGRFGGALAYNKTLHVFDSSKILYKEDFVENFYLSNEYLIIQKEDKIDILHNYILKESINDVRIVFLHCDKAILTLKKSKLDKPILLFYDVKALKPISQHEFEYIHKLEVKADKNQKYFLLSIVVERNSTSYYSKPRLYLFDIAKASLKHVNIAKIPLFFDFVDNGILVMHGDQPCETVILDYNLNIKKTFEKGVRNRGYFNIHNNLICFAGLDNLSGNIEIHSSELLAKFKLLGASKITWSKNGSYLIVAITNKLKVDNMIQVYDYYGRLIKEQHYDNLINVDWIGKKKDFIALEKPEIKNITNESAYVPPHLRKKANQKQVKSNTTKKCTSRKAEAQVDIKSLEMELNEIKLLKERSINGEVLDMKDMNKLLKEDEILKMLEINK